MIKKAGFHSSMTRRGGLSREATVHTAKKIKIKTALKIIYKIDDKHLVIHREF